MKQTISNLPETIENIFKKLPETGPGYHLVVNDSTQDTVVVSNNNSASEPTKINTIEKLKKFKLICNNRLTINLQNI